MAGALSERLEPILALLEQTDGQLTARFGPRFSAHVRGLGHPQAFVEQQAESFRDARLEGATVLDLGCGFGLSAACFAALGARSVIGVDADLYLVNLGQIVISDALPAAVASRVHLEHRDLAQDPFEPGLFDAVTALGALSRVESLPAAIALIRHHLKPGGRVLVTEGRSSYHLMGRIKRRMLWLVDHKMRDRVSRGLSPIHLCRLFAAAGFEPDLLPPHGDVPPERLHPRRLVREGLRVLYPLTLPAFPEFRLLMTDVRDTTRAGTRAPSTAPSAAGAP